jgi:hypothetical protein
MKLRRQWRFELQSDRFIPWCLSLIIFFLFAGQTLAQEEEEEEGQIADERPTLRAGALPTDFKFDGLMNGPAWWGATDSIANLIMIEPEEGGVPAGRTIVKVLANANEIVIGVFCEDIHPEGLVSFSKARDSELAEEDHILIVFDTFLDGRSGYVFGVNPEGARFDGLVIEQGEDVNTDWDAIWEAKTSRDENGWCAEMRIPIKSISFKEDLTTWGFNVQRRVQRLQETSRWGGASLDYEIYQTSRAGLLTDLPNFDLGLGLSIRPAITGDVTRRESGGAFIGDVSLDATQRLGPNLLSALTVNTDFAETEVDVRQVNLTRFPVFFPEKRTFFLQGADIFEFGLGLDEDNLLPFFSRRIGLLGRDEDDQPEIPINVGGKIYGRIDNTNIGALVANTRKVSSLQVGDVDEDIKIHVPQTTMGVVRIRQNILEESSLGVLATFGDQLAKAQSADLDLDRRTGSWSAGVDFTYRTSNFLDEKNFLVGVWGLLNDRADLHGDKSAFGFRIDYPNDLLDINFTSIRIGDGFDPSLGFVPRDNVHIWDFTAEYNPRPSWPLVRQMTHELAFTLYNKRNNSAWESYNVTIKPLNWLLESGDQFEFGIEPEGDRPPEPFEISGSVDLRPGSYEWIRYVVGAHSAEKRKISGEIKWEFGDYYNGDLNTIEGRLALKPSSFLTLEFTGERNTGKVMALPDDFEELLEALLEDDVREEFHRGIVRHQTATGLFSRSAVQQSYAIRLGEPAIGLQQQV